MSLRCRPGDLAIVIRSNFGNEGREVEVLRYLWRGDESDEMCMQWDSDAPVWLVKARYPLNHPQNEIPKDKSYGLFGDDQLMPIRPEREPESTPTDVSDYAHG